MLRQGCPLPEALALAQQIESNSELERELDGWQKALAQGRAKPAEFLPAESRFPPLFRVLLVEAGDELHAGFARAAESFQARAAARTELLLHAAIPVAVLVLGALILMQLVGPLSAVFQLMNVLGE